MVSLQQIVAEIWETNAGVCTSFNIKVASEARLHLTWAANSDGHRGVLYKEPGNYMSEICHEHDNGNC